MSSLKNIWQYYWIRFTASAEHDADLQEVGASSVVKPAPLIARAIVVGATITARVRDKANSLDLG